MRKLYFLGVDTRASAVNRLFPIWAELLGLTDAALVGLDAPQGAPALRIREMLLAVTREAEAAGALVTTHKVAVVEHGRDLFEPFDPDTESLGEVSCIVKRHGRLFGYAIDHLSSELPLREVAGERFAGEVLLLGAGGAARGISVQLRRSHRPTRVIATDVSEQRLHEFAAITGFETSPAEHNNSLVERLAPGALIINATGLGKDRPGSPLADGVRFPQHAVAWDLNYRGELLFLDQARRGGARTDDGWLYFIAGWLTIMCRVYDRPLTPELLARAVALTKR